MGKGAAPYMWRRPDEHSVYLHSVRPTFLHVLSSLSPITRGTRVQVLIASCEGGEIDLVIQTHEAYLRGHEARGEREEDEAARWKGKRNVVDRWIV